MSDLSEADDRSSAVKAKVNSEIGPLNEEEKQELIRCEQVYADRTRPFYEWGWALATIKQRRLFRGSHKTFNEYCREKWRISRIQAYRLIKAAEIVNNFLLPMGNVPMPTCERQVRPMVNCARTLISKVWRQAIADAAGNDVSAHHVVRAIAKLASSGRTKGPNRKQSRTVAQSLRDGTRSPGESRKHLSTLARTSVGLTEREREILELAGYGISDKEIAQRFNLAYSTINSHMKNMFRKLGVHSRFSAIHKAVGWNEDRPPGKLPAMTTVVRATNP